MKKIELVMVSDCSTSDGNGRMEKKVNSQMMIAFR